MHQDEEKISQKKRDEIRGRFDSYYIGWCDAGMSLDCLPPPGPASKRREYIRGWSRRSGNALSNKG